MIQKKEFLQKKKVFEYAGKKGADRCIVG